MLFIQGNIAVLSSHFNITPKEAPEVLLQARHRLLSTFMRPSSGRPAVWLGACRAGRGASFPHMGMEGGCEQPG